MSGSVRRVGEIVYVDGVRIAGPVSAYSRRRQVEAIRERTPDEWWIMAASIDNACQWDEPGGPLGAGVAFFAWDRCPVPHEVAQEIADDAYEAAREVILAGLDEFEERMAPVLTAVAGISAVPSLDAGATPQ